MVAMAKCFFSLALLALFCSCAKAELSPEDHQDIVDKHNELRRDVSPTASDMEEMVWKFAS